MTPEGLAGGDSNRSPRSQRVTDTVAVLAATLFVLWKLDPGLLITPTITTGGDTASHYYTAWWLRHELLPDGRLTGWVPGNYAGFPLFQVYFPLPFVLMAALSLVVGLPLAFKWVTVAGLVALPAAAYVSFRLIGWVFPAPALAAAFSVLFLFHEGNSMWGANVTSTLAGEFTYSFATALLVVFAGTLYRGATRERGWAGNAMLLAAIGLSHPYALLAAASWGAYLVLFHPRGRRAFPYLLGVAGMAFALMGFWVVPLLAYAEYTTAYSIVWPIRGFTHVFPPIFWPLLLILAGGVVAMVVRRLRNGAPARRERSFDHRVIYLASIIPGSIFLYLIAWKIDVVDMRFLPFAQLAVVLLAAVPVAQVMRAFVRRRMRRREPGAALALLTLLTVAGALLWTASFIDVADDWATWNYAGFEAAPGWPAYAAVNDTTRRTEADPRVAYEHTTAHDDAGTTRAFESLPLFSGASTLEGVYMQSTISSPFVFYIQSEISQIPSCPLLPYHCGRLDAARAAEHLRLFNVSDVIARGDRVKAELAASPEFLAGDEIPPYRMFHVAGGDGAYVEALRYRPLVLSGDTWKADFFAWFKRPGSGDVPLVRADSGEGRGTVRGIPPEWPRISGLPDGVPRRALATDVEVSSELSAEEINIRTSRPGHPLLVKVSYHPRWRAEGADGVWLASPSFMLVVPRQEEVRLVYGPGPADRWGGALTVFGVAWLLLAGFRALTRGADQPRPGGRGRGDGSTPPARAGRAPAAVARVQATGTRLVDKVFAFRGAWGPLLAVVLALTAVMVRWSWNDPWTLHRQGLELFHDGRYEDAEPLLLRSIAAAPSSPAAYYSDYYHSLSAFRMRRWEETLARFGDFLRDYPDSELAGEAHFHVAEALQNIGRSGDAAARFLHIIDELPTSPWAGYAVERLEALMAERAGPATGAGASAF